MKNYLWKAIKFSTKLSFILFATLMSFLRLDANDLCSVNNPPVTQSLIDLGIVDPAGCNALGDPYIYSGDCTIGITRYISRAANMEFLSLLNQPGKCWDYLPLPIPDRDAEVNCTPPYDKCESRYCPTKYAKQIGMLKDLNIAFVARAASAWFHEHIFVPGKDNFISAQQLVIDINAAYDCAGLRRPIVQAGIFEDASANNVKKVPIPGELIFDFLDEMSTSERIYYFNSNGIPKPEIKFNRSRMGPGGEHLDITKVETRLWYLYQAKHYIDMGYKAIHMGIFWEVARNDPGYYTYYSVLERMRKYARDNSTFVLLNGENRASEGSAKLGDTDHLLFDFDGVAMRPREVVIPPVAADSPGVSCNGNNPNTTCDDAINRQVFEGTPCENVEFLAIIDACRMEYCISSPNGNTGGISPSGCYYENVPYYVYFDFGTGAVFEDGDNCKDILEQASSGDETSCGGSNLTWGYEDTRWFAEKLTDECRAWWWEYYYCERRDFHNGTGFLQIPGMLNLSHHENNCNDIMPNGTGGVFMLSDQQDLMDVITNTLEPTDPEILVVEICEPESILSNRCGDIYTHPRKYYNVSQRYYKVTAEGTDCSSTYTIHIQDPSGNWLPSTDGKEIDFYPQHSGTYTFYLRQDNLGFDPGTFGTVTVQDQKYLETAPCCQGPFPYPLPYISNGNNGNVNNVESFRLSNEILMNDEISCYPNPTSNNVLIISKSNQIISNLTIYNSIGQLVKSYSRSSEKFDINFQDLSVTPGVYFIEGIINNEKHFTSVIYQ